MYRPTCNVPHDYDSVMFLTKILLSLVVRWKAQVSRREQMKQMVCSRGVIGAYAVASVSTVRMRISGGGGQMEGSVQRKVQTATPALHEAAILRTCTVCTIFCLCIMFRIPTSNVNH